LRRLEGAERYMFTTPMERLELSWDRAKAPAP